MPLSGPAAFGATTLAGATAAAHDSKRSDTEKLLKSAEVNFKDPIAVKDFIQKHKEDFRKSDARAMHTFIANLVGAGASKYVGKMLGMDEIEEAIIDQGLGISIEKTLGPKEND